MRTDELDYSLPAELIATRPAEPRDAARLLVVHRSADRIEHRCVRDVVQYLNLVDAMVFNTTSVAPARLVGRRANTGGRMEGLFLRKAGPNQWIVMLTSGGKLRAGERVELRDAQDQATEWNLELVEKRGAEWLVQVTGPSGGEAALEQAGRTPLPPYILRARGPETVPDALDRGWYQTVYADPTSRRSVAAPTAGLHFTPELLRDIDTHGVRRLFVTLDVGQGTFKPVTVASLEEHAMHSEQFQVPIEVLRALHERERRLDGAAPPRVIAVGTTVVRALESLPTPVPTDRSRPFVGETRLLIAPPYAFRHVDALLTNFHLPRSTLLALVAAMLGLERLKAAYAEAIANRYRFYSYGDAMLILP